MIFVFSGTGNSLHVAQQLGKLLGDQVVKIEKGLPHCDNRIVWVFPVYSWGVPPVVEDIIRNYQGAKGIEHYAVMTCGDDCGQTHKQWRKLIAKIGGRDMSTYSVQMPNTYVFMSGFDVDPDDVATVKLKSCDERIEYIARQIENHTEGVDNVVAGSFAWAKSKIVYPWFKRYAMSPRPFHATESCTGCGLCSRACPLGNISIIDGKPIWSDICALCTRCYHICPTHAVAYGKTTHGKGQYKTLIKTTLRDEATHNEPESKESV